jgi:hypothetical protein
MQISGLNYRSIFEQQGLSFDLTSSINNLSGSGEFGFSGENNQISFKFNSGRIYDFEDRYVFSYLKDSNFQISGNLDTDTYSYHINDNPVCFNGLKNNFKIKNFYANTDSNSILDIDLKIYGESPNYEVFVNDQYYINSFLTGVISNKSLLDFRIFSGNISEASETFSIVTLPFVVSGINQSNIVFQPNTGEGQYNLTLNLYTDFGLVSQNFTTTGVAISLADIIFYLTPKINFLSANSQKKYLTPDAVIAEQSYSLYHQGIDEVGEEYYGFSDNISFEYLEGYLGNISGNMSGITMNSTGINNDIFYFTGQRDILLTGYNTLIGYTLNGEPYTGYNLQSTGFKNFIGSGSGEKFIYVKMSGSGYIYYSGIVPVTGEYSIDFNMTGTGSASGYILNHPRYFLTGYTNLIYDGSSSGKNILGSGTYLFYTSGISGDFTGSTSYLNKSYIYKDKYLNQTGHFFKTEYITGIKEVTLSGRGTGISIGYANTFFTNSGYVTYTGIIVNTGFLTRDPDQIFAKSGKYSGDISSAIQTGRFSGVPLFTGFILNSSNQYIPTNKYMTATGIFSATSYGIITENFSNYSGVFYNSSGGLVYGPGIKKPYDFSPSNIIRDNLILMKDTNPTQISGNYFRTSAGFDGTVTGGWINKINKFGDLYFVLGNFKTAGIPGALESKRGGFLLSGNELSILDWDPNVGKETRDCYLDPTGALYISGLKMTVYHNTSNNTIDPNWQPSFILSDNSKNIDISHIFSGETNEDLYMIGDFQSTSKIENLKKFNQRDIKSIGKNNRYLLEKITRIDKTSGFFIPQKERYLDYIGEKGFNGFSINNAEPYDLNEKISCYHRTGNKLYLGGNFNTIGDVPRQGVAVYSKDGKLQPANPVVNCYVQNEAALPYHSIGSVVSTGDHIFLCGKIGSFGGDFNNYKEPTYGITNLADNMSRHMVMRCKDPITLDRSFFDPHMFGTSSYPQVSEVKDYKDRVYVGGCFDVYKNITGKVFPRTGIAVLSKSGDLLEQPFDLLGISNFDSEQGVRAIFITGSTGYFGGCFTGVEIKASNARYKRYGFFGIDLETNEILPNVFDIGANNFVLSIQHFNQRNWIQSKNGINPQAEIIDTKLNDNTLIVLGNFDKLYTGYGHINNNTTTNVFAPDPNGFFFVGAETGNIRYTETITGTRIIKYLSNATIVTGENFQQLNHRDIIRLKNINLNDTFNFIYGTGVDYQYSSTTYNDYNEIRVKTLNDIAAYINNPNSLTLSSPPNWSNLYNNYTGILENNSLNIRYKTSGTYSGDFPFASLEHIGLGLFQKNFSISENNKITGEADPSQGITKKYLGDFCAATKTGEIIIVGNSNWRNQSVTIPSGAVYVYKNINNNFELIQLISGTGHGSQRIHSHYGFNGDINYDGSIIAIGAKNYISGSRVTGIVDIYTGNNNIWSFNQKISGIFSGLGTGDSTSNNFTGRNFGKSLSLDYFGNRIAISDVLKRNNETGSNIHIFQNNNNKWGLENIINLSPYDIYDIKLNDYGNVLAIGQSTGLGGNIKIITKTGIDWSTALTGEVSSESPNSQIYLGASIDMNSIGNTIVAGAPNSINNNINCGAVFVYTGMNTNWYQIAKITGNNLVSGERFGHSVSINKDATIMSIFSKNADTGKAYIFTGFESTWKQYEEISGFSGVWSGLSGDYIKPESGINNVLCINDSGNLLFICDPTSGVVRSFNIPYQSKPLINQFDGGYEERSITFNYPRSTYTNYNDGDYRGYLKLNDDYYYLYGQIVRRDSSSKPYINGITLPAITSTSGNAIVLINNTGGWETGSKLLFGDGIIFGAEIIKNKIYVGGTFTKIGLENTPTKNRNYIACVDTGIGEVLDIFSDLSLNSHVYDVKKYNDNILVTGPFSKETKRNIILGGFCHLSESGNVLASLSSAFSNARGLNKSYVDNEKNIYIFGKTNTLGDYNNPGPHIGSKVTGGNSSTYGYTDMLPIVCLSKSPSGYTIPNSKFNNNLPVITNAVGLNYDPRSVGSATYVNVIVTGQSGLYIGGNFNNINGKVRNNCALIGYDGTLKEWAPNFNGPVYDMIKSGDSLFIAGDFDFVNSYQVYNFCQVQATGACLNAQNVNQNFTPIIDTSSSRYVSKIFFDSNYLYIGGSFASAGSPSIARTGIAAFDLFGNHIPSLTNNISIQNTYTASAVWETLITSIEKINDIFLIGGFFDTVNKKNISDFVPIKSNGEIVSFPSGVISRPRTARNYYYSNVISDIKVYNNNIYLVGTSIIHDPQKESEGHGGGNLGGACRLIYTGNKFILDNNWAPCFEPSPQDYYVRPGAISARKMILDDDENAYIFGTFRRAGKFRNKICEIYNNEVTSFNPMINNHTNIDSVNVIKSYDDNSIIIGGNFTKFYDSGAENFIKNKNHLAVIDLNTSKVTDWGERYTFDSNASTSTILVDKNKQQIHVGGRFPKITITGKNVTGGAQLFFNNLLAFDYASGSKVTMKPHIIDNDVDDIPIYVNDIIKKDENSLFIGGKIGRVAQYVEMTGSEGVLSSGVGLYQNYLESATGTVFVSGIFTGFANYQGFNKKDITGEFLADSQNYIYSSGSIFVGPQNQLINDDILIISHRNSSGLWPFIYKTGPISSTIYADSLSRIQFTGLSHLNNFINNIEFELNNISYSNRIFKNLYKYFNSNFIKDEQGEKIIIRANSTGAKYPHVNIIHMRAGALGNGVPEIVQLSGEENNEYYKTNLTLAENQSIKNTNIFTQYTGVQEFKISFLSGETSNYQPDVTGIWISTGNIQQTFNINMTNANKGIYSFSQNFSGEPSSARLLSRNDGFLTPLYLFTGYSNESKIISGFQAPYVYSGEYYNVIISDNKFSGEFNATGLISGTDTGVSRVSSFTKIVTGNPYYFDNSRADYSGVILTNNIFSGLKSYRLTGSGSITENFLFTGITGLNLTGTGFLSFNRSATIIGITPEVYPVANTSIFTTIFASGLDNNMTGSYNQTVFVSGLNGPFFGTNFLSSGIIPDAFLYEKTFTGSFEVETGRFEANDISGKLPIQNSYELSSTVFMQNISYFPFGIKIRYKNYHDKLPLVGKLLITNSSQNKIISENITGVIL